MCALAPPVLSKTIRRFTRSRLSAPGPLSRISSPSMPVSVPLGLMPVNVTSMYGRVSSDCRLTVWPVNGAASVASGTVTAAPAVSAASVNCCTAALFVERPRSWKVCGRNATWIVLYGSVGSAVVGSANWPVNE